MCTWYLDRFRLAAIAVPLIPHSPDAHFLFRCVRDLRRSPAFIYIEFGIDWSASPLLSSASSLIRMTYSVEG
jgi:hypothetical protein